MYRDAQQSHCVETLTTAKRSADSLSQPTLYFGSRISGIDRMEIAHCAIVSNAERLKFALKGLYFIIASRVIVDIVLKITPTQIKDDPCAHPLSMVQIQALSISARPI